MLWYGMEGVVGMVGIREGFRKEEFRRIGEDEKDFSGVRGGLEY